MPRTSSTKKDTTSTSIRVPNDIKSRFDAELDNHDVSMNELVNDWIETWTLSGGKVDPLEGGKQTSSAAQEKQLAKIVAAGVGGIIVELLQSDTSWAQQVIRTAQLRWPGGVLEDRMAHYAEEKIFLAKRFADWLGKRMEHLLRKDDVHFLVDAGSTNLWFCRYFWEHLAKLSATPRQCRIAIVTNNVPVANDFAEQCHRGLFKARTKITCELLGGEIEPQYGAVLGPLTHSHVKDQKERRQRGLLLTEANLKDRTDHAKWPGTYIALSAGNFVRLNHLPPYPIALIRGEGQKEIKDLYISRAREIYVLAPLAKIFLHGVTEINDALGLVENSPDPQKQQYAEVNVERGKGRYVKLVTTSRSSPECILHDHSTVLNTLLRRGPGDIGELKDGEPSPTGNIEEMPHFCYVYEDHLRGKSPEEQLKIEFPHKATRDKKFRERFFKGRIDGDSRAGAAGEW